MPLKRTFYKPEVSFPSWSAQRRRDGRVELGRGRTAGDRASTGQGPEGLGPRTGSRLGSPRTSDRWPRRSLCWSRGNTWQGRGASHREQCCGGQPRGFPAPWVQTPPLTLPCRARTDKSLWPWARGRLFAASRGCCEDEPRRAERLPPCGSSRETHGEGVCRGRVFTAAGDTAWAEGGVGTVVTTPSDLRDEEAADDPVRSPNTGNYRTPLTLMSPHVIPFH